MEIITQKSFEYWGPWAITVIILGGALVSLAYYFVARQKKWDEKDEYRITSFIELDEKRSQSFIQSQQQNREITMLLSENVKSNTKALDELRNTTHAMNEALIRMNARRK